MKRRVNFVSSYSMAFNAVEYFNALIPVELTIFFSLPSDSPLLFPRCPFFPLSFFHIRSRCYLESARTAVKFFAAYPRVQAAAVTHKIYGH